MSYTHTLYRNSIKLIYGKDHRVIAESDIKCGELLLLEHVVSGTLNNVRWIVGNNERLFDCLYPRQDRWISICEDEKKRQSQGDDKVHCNSFGNIKKHVAVGHDVSFFNHSCNANVLVRELKLKESFIALFAIRPIKQGEEVFISYYNTYGHEARSSLNGVHWRCDCKMSLSERQQRGNIINAVSDQLFMVTETKLIAMILKYCKSDVGKGVILLNRLAKEGMYYGNEDIACRTKRISSLLAIKYPEEVDFEVALSRYERCILDEIGMEFDEMSTKSMGTW